MAYLFKSIGSFAGDYSGAGSVLQDLDGMIIFCDAGACMGGFLFGEDPKGSNEDRRIFTASLREKQVVMGIDKKVKKDAVRTYKDVGGEFIGLIGTPVSAVIGADLEGIGKEICAQLQKDGLTEQLLKNIAVRTNGLEFYDAGQEKAYQALADALIDENTKTIGDVNVIGATSIDMWDYNQITDCIDLLKEAGAKAPMVWGANGGIHEIAGAAGAKLNIAVSVSGIKTVKDLHKKYGTPYLIGYPLGAVQTKQWKDTVHNLLTGCTAKTADQNVAVRKNGRRALIIHEQLTACALRDLLETEFGYETVDVASFFKMNKGLKQKNDIQIKEEAVITAFLREQEKYDLVVADPLCFGLIPYETKKIMLPHIAVSAIVFANKSPNIFGEKASAYFQKMLAE